MLNPGSALDLDIGALSSEGQGIGRADGLAVFVDGLVPGDRARVRVVRAAARHVNAAVEALLVPSPDRVPPFCADYAACGAGEEEAEGIVESLRAVEGVEAAAVVKEQSKGARVRVSLRSSALDVSAIAALRGGGGHRLAAGFSSDDSPEEVRAWLSSELARRLSTASS